MAGDYGDVSDLDCTFERFMTLVQNSKGLITEGSILETIDALIWESGKSADTTIYRPRPDMPIYQNGETVDFLVVIRDKDGNTKLKGLEVKGFVTVEKIKFKSTSLHRGEAIADYGKTNLNNIVDIRKQLDGRPAQLKCIGLENRDDMIGIISLRNVPAEAVQNLQLIETIQKAKIKNLDIVCPDGKDVEWTHKRDAPAPSSEEL